MAESWNNHTATPLADIRALQEQLRTIGYRPAPGTHRNPVSVTAEQWAEHRGEFRAYGYHVVNMVTGEHQCP